MDTLQWFYFQETHFPPYFGMVDSLVCFLGVVQPPTSFVMLLRCGSGGNARRKKMAERTRKKTKDDVITKNVITKM